jgi:hypothetical protein
MRHQMFSAAALSACAFMLAGFCSVANASEPTKPSQSRAAGTSILIDTDDLCRLTVDDEDKGEASPDHPVRVRVGPGSHIVKCVNDASSDLIWRKVIEVKRGEQATALVALRALHSQLEQAAAQKEQATRDQAQRETQRVAYRQQCQSSCSSEKQSCLSRGESDEEACTKRIPGMGGMVDALAAGVGECPISNFNECRGVQNPGLCMQELNDRRQECLREHQERRSAALQECSDRAEAVEPQCNSQYQRCVSRCDAH